MVYDVWVKGPINKGEFYRGVFETASGSTPEEALADLLSKWESRSPKHGSAITRIKLVPQEVSEFLFERRDPIEDWVEV